MTNHTKPKPKPKYAHFKVNPGNGCGVYVVRADIIIIKFSVQLNLPTGTELENQ